MSNPAAHEKKAAASPVEDWLRARNLGRYLLYCLLGPGLPMVLALFTIPKVVDLLGVERFGLLTIVWAVLGYFSLFDLGLGRACARLFAEKSAAGEAGLLRPIVTTGLGATGLLGLVGTAVLAIAAPFLVGDFFKISPGYQQEALQAFWIMSISIPFVSLTGVLRGVLEVQQRFRLTNVIQVFLGAVTYIGPLVVLLIDNSLTLVVGVLLAARAGTFFVYLIISYGRLPKAGRFSFQIWIFARLVRMGGWLTVSNAIGPIMVYFDRFLIGAALSMAAVAYYTTPYEVVFRLTVLSSAIAQVLFPAMATHYFTSKEKTTALFKGGFITVAALAFPVIALVIVFAPEGLHLWLGGAFAFESATLTRVLAAGVFLNMLAQIPFIHIQSAERADISAKIHMLELIAYLPLVWFFAHAWGLTGVAMAWALRAGADFILMSLVSFWLMPELRGFPRRGVLTCVFALPLAALAVWMDTLVGRALFGLAVMLAFYLALWFFVLEKSHRAWVRDVAARSLRSTRLFHL